MYRLTVFLLAGSLLFGLVSCSNNEKGVTTEVVQNPVTADGNGDLDQLPKIEFEKDIHDFGKVIQGENVTYSFHFKNSGKSDLLIHKVSASCGCTVPRFERKPIAPGTEGEINVTFDSKGRRGFQNKVITVLSNTQPNTYQLRIKAQVVTPEEI